MSRARTYTSEELAQHLELLNHVYEFPTEVPHKFIGKNTDLFRQAVETLEKDFPALSGRRERYSESRAHLSLTYTFQAESAEAMIQLLQRTQLLSDLLWIL